MRCFNESIARKANREDGCKGRFWEGRFKSQALLDDGALLTCMAYVDLNPVRAGITDTPETSQFTSIWERIQAVSESSNVIEKTGEQQFTSEEKTNPEKTTTATTKEPHVPLMKFRAKTGPIPKRAFIPIKWEEYLGLLDWAGREIRTGKKGSIPEGVPSIFARLGLQQDGWIKTVQGFKTCFARVVGKVELLKVIGNERGQKWMKGVMGSKVLYASNPC